MNERQIIYLLITLYPVYIVILYLLTYKPDTIEHRLLQYKISLINQHLVKYNNQYCKLVCIPPIIYRGRQFWGELLFLIINQILGDPNILNYKITIIPIIPSKLIPSSCIITNATFSSWVGICIDEYHDKQGYNLNKLILYDRLLKNCDRITSLNLIEFNHTFIPFDFGAVNCLDDYQLINDLNKTKYSLMFDMNSHIEQVRAFRKTFSMEGKKMITNKISHFLGTDELIFVINHIMDTFHEMYLTCGDLAHFLIDYKYRNHDIINTRDDFNKCVNEIFLDILMI
jgi:hypothetical protein